MSLCPLKLGRKTQVVLFAAGGRLAGEGEAALEGSSGMPSSFGHPALTSALALGVCGKMSRHTGARRRKYPGKPTQVLFLTFSPLKKI